MLIQRQFGRQILVIPDEWERRSEPRIVFPFPVTVRGADKNGLPFQHCTVIDNICSGGLFVRLARPVALGARLHIGLSVSSPAWPQELRRGQRVAISAKVIRVECRLGAAFGVGVTFVRRHFF